MWAATGTERQDLQRRIDRLKALAAEFDPNVKGQVLQEALFDEANRYHRERDVFLEKDRNLDYSQILLELSILVAAVAILAVNRWLIVLAGIGAGAGTLLLINDITLWVHLPM